MKKLLPEVVFIGLDENVVSIRGGNKPLIAKRSKEFLVQMGEVREIGEYVLKRRIEIQGVVAELREIG